MSIDINTLATRTAQIADLTESAAFDILGHYINQIEQVDGREIDTDTISDDDAAFLAETVRQARRAGDLGHRELATLEEHVQAVDIARDDLQTQIQQRDDAIRAALAAGARVKDVIDVTGLARQRITQITSRL